MEQNKIALLRLLGRLEKESISVILLVCLLAYYVYSDNAKQERLYVLIENNTKALESVRSNTIAISNFETMTFKRLDQIKDDLSEIKFLIKNKK